MCSSTEYQPSVCRYMASAFLHTAAEAEAQSLELRQYNAWKTGKIQINPAIARHHFLLSSISHAASHQCKIFISLPLVYSHLQNSFWPSRNGYAASLSTTLIANLLLLPLLPFLTAGQASAPSLSKKEKIPIELHAPCTRAVLKSNGNLLTWGR